MSAIALEKSTPTVDLDDTVLRQNIQAACSRIAPVWPLDSFIAVNPWWGFVAEPARRAFEKIAVLSRSKVLMPRTWYEERLRDGSIDPTLLERVSAEHDKQADLNVAASARHRPLMTELLDQQPRSNRQIAVRDVVIQSIGQVCAMWFDRGQALWHARSEETLYHAWREVYAHDNTPALLIGLKGFARRIRALPQDHHALIAAATKALGLAHWELSDYFSALLLDINGWASWCAYQNWPANPQPSETDALEHLLAIRLAWEWMLYDAYHDQLDPPTLVTENLVRCELDACWPYQRALEQTWQRRVNQALSRSPTSGETAERMNTERPALQAVFCIDVRSEPMRRALEMQSDAIRTHGFAGFFGLPVDYRTAGSETARPQLPGLLAPKLHVVDQASDAEYAAKAAGDMTAQLVRKHVWQRVKSSASAGFGFVESTGLTFGWHLLKNSLARREPVRQHSQSEQAAQCKPALIGLTSDERVDLLQGIVRAMSLENRLARLVLLLGHGSETRNNPHAAGLDCGACCGQTGEVNARVLADLLNDQALREGLAIRGFDIPSDTWFVAGLHNTTTDEVTLWPSQQCIASCASELAQASSWLQSAGSTARRERAASLGLSSSNSDRDLLNAVRERAHDWAQVRPEWGLANNAGFIAAPRSRTRKMKLDGRVFLHDYDPARDADHSILEQIMTAPMIVAHWINLQYYASTVDNRRWGSGNKVLHNVVGGNIGVFEGNGGDLRIGLPFQSVNDGTQWRHQPLRLSVWLEASQAAIDAVIGRQQLVRDLVYGQWLYVLRIDPVTGAVFQCQPVGDSAHVWSGITP